MVPFSLLVPFSIGGRLMKILNCRVDDRLVHGCVATMWVPKLNVERVICIDDESAN